MTEFFELAASRDLGPDRANRTIAKLPKKRLLEFAEEAGFRAASPRIRDASDFGFAANNTLSGGAYPCAEPPCRVSQASAMARFAALYADRLVVRNPFADYPSSLDVSFLRMRLEGDLAVLNVYRPLIEAGIVSVAPPVVALCADCARQFASQRERLLALLDEAGDALLERYESRVAIKRLKTGGILISGPEEIVSHREHVLIPDRTSVFNGRLSRNRKRRLVRTLISPILKDVYLHHLHSRHTGLNYLTDRRADVAVARTLGGPAVRRLDRTLIDGLAHTIPFVHGVPTEDILRLRREEGESFAVYRNAVCQLVRAADLSSGEAVTKAYYEQVKPEVDRLDLAVRNASKAAGKSVQRDVVIGTVGISIGLLVGVVEPAIGTLVTALGGVEALRGLAGKALDSVSEPPVIRENSFYFLWRLKSTQRTGRLITR